ncbi:MAG: YdbH domain-containing protein [Candidatus Omnitrophica bacterium]|nr:YdbH domain-containing protein [Candidatus Omnitrophota bacterium]
MKKAILLLAVVSILTCAVVFAVKPLILTAAQKQLHAVFMDAAVSIKDCRFDPLRRLSFLDVVIKMDKVYGVTIGEISINYDPSSIVKKSIQEVILKDVDINIDYPQKSILALGQYVKPGSGGMFSVKQLSLSNLNLNILSKDLTLDAKASAELKVAEKSLKSVSLDIDSLESGKFLLKGGDLKINERLVLNTFHVQDIKYDKARITGLKGTVRLKGRGLVVEAFSMQAYGGQITGDVTLAVNEVPEYSAHLKFVDLGIEGFLRDFKLDERFQMTGGVNGTLVIDGKGTDLDILSGDFSMAKAGGMLTIKDTRMMENLAQSSNQPLDILVESFRQYHYNSGTVALSLDENNIILDLALDGEAGKRNLNITLHDFK